MSFRSSAQARYTKIGELMLDRLESGEHSSMTRSEIETGMAERRLIFPEQSLILDARRSIAPRDRPRAAKTGELPRHGRLYKSASVARAR
ncbi:MAG: hypothetical protein C3F11_00580 [Methylocystaceae bacterium]|nr:MAG: hypothetical protein C3F11_00580 [Methylocystaceae bacterium]